MVLSGMSDVGLIAILVAAFLLAIGLVRVLGRLIASDAAEEGWADEPPDTGGTGIADTGAADTATGTGTNPGGLR